MGPRRAALAALLLLAPTAPPAVPPPTLRDVPCGGRLPAALARCVVLAVPEDHTRPAGRRIDVHAAVLPARDAAAGAPPLYVLAGGPGQGVAELAERAPELYEGLRRTRDVVLMDQRGTGRSNPLRCDVVVPTAAGDDALLARLTADLFEPAALDACRRRLARGADLARYATADAMRDLDLLRAALGHARVDLHGTSYGTRAALVYARLFPRHVRAMVLHAVVPTSASAPVQVALDGQRALDGVVAACAAERACAAAFPDLAGDLARLGARLRRGAVTATVAHPATGAPTRVTVSAEWAAEALRYMLYAPATAVRLPATVHAAAADDFAPLVGFGLRHRATLLPQIAFGMGTAVMCSEDVPGMTDADVARAEGTLTGAGRARRLRVACRDWPVAPLPAPYREPLRSDVPTLLVAGADDPAASPAAAAAVARGLPRSRVVTIPEGGHGTAGLVDAACVDRVVVAFLDAGRPEAVDASCLRAVRRPPFATAVE